MAGCVAPFAGAWIEIVYTYATNHPINVAPFAGAWIEILIICAKTVLSFVAPFAGAWIEMNDCQQNKGMGERRSLRGSVD